MPQVGRRVEVSVRMGLRTRVTERDAALVDAVADDSAVLEVRAGRNVGDLKRLDRLKGNVNVGVAVPLGGRLLLTALVQTPHDAVEPAQSHAEGVVMGRLGEALQGLPARDPGVELVTNEGWYVESRTTTAAHLYSYLGEFGPPIVGPD